MLKVLKQIEYSGTVWALSHNDPEPLVQHSIKKIQECGVKKEDMMFGPLLTLLVPS